MSRVQLFHDKALKLPSPKKMLGISDEVIKKYSDSTFISFRMNKKYKPDIRIKNVNACTRFINKFSGDIVFYGLEVDSPLAPVILWDVAHTLAVGNTITMLEDYVNDHYYEKDYYKNSFEIIERSKNKIVFKKVKKLTAECSTGLDDWTFGIPVGPGDATILNAVVKRILEIDVPQKEIILCGRPGENFKYFDEVKIVGEDIPAPPVLISKKKNTIVNYAKYNNLCILHDRVFLPKDFYTAMKKYGDYYSYTTLQSLYFDDFYNAMPRRYSDFGLIKNGLPAGGIEAISSNKETLRYSSFTNNLFADLEVFNFYVESSAVNYNSNNYPTGSLYIVKKDVWKKCPQDESLKWEEFEDVESGLRANAEGIISRINPYSFTQSICSRPILLGLEGGRVVYSSSDFKVKKWRPFTQIFSFKTKPLIKLSQDAAIEKLLFFQNKYCHNSSERIVIPGKMDAITRHSIITQLIFKAEFELSTKNILEFINDVKKFLFLDTIPYSYKRYLYYEFINGNQNNAKNSLVNCDIILCQLSLRKRSSIFYSSLEDYFLKSSWRVKLGTFFSAVYLNLKNKDIVYNPEGVKGFYSAIINSTPFDRYLESEG